MQNKKVFNETEYKKEYGKMHYDKILIQFRKDEFLPKLIEKAMVKRRMQSRTEYIKMAIEAQLRQDGIDVDKMREVLQSVQNGDE